MMVDKKFNLVKLVSSVVVLVLLVGGVIWGMGETFARKDAIEEKFLIAEQKVVQTFEVFQTKQSAETDKVQLEIYHIQLNNLTERYYRLKREIKNVLNNQELKNEYEDVKKRKASVIEKINKLLERVK
jgi:predicted  nucleic acid-binding Zn-ribbon protein